MKVENFNSNYAMPRTQKRVQQQRIAQPQFTGNVGKLATDADVTKYIMELLPGKKGIAVMEKFKVLKGELGGILITAFGTGLVAPIFIGLNPFVKAKPDATEEEKQEVRNTKAYTAMRQPISAVLAALFQAGALNPIDKYLEKITNESDHAKKFFEILDQSALQKKSYLERIVAKELKAGETKYPDKKAFKKAVAEEVEKRQTNQANALMDHLAKTGQIRIGKERVLDNQTTAGILNHTIDSYIDSAENLKIGDKGIKFYEKRAGVLLRNEAELNEIFSAEKLPSDTKELEQYLKTTRETSSKEVQELIEEILSHHPNVRESRCQRTLERIEKIKQACGGEYSAEKYTQSMHQRNSEITQLIESLKESKIPEGELGSVTEATIKERLTEVAKKCHYDSENRQLHKILDGSGTFQTNLEKLQLKIRKDIIDGYKAVVENKFKGFSQISKVAIGVFITLPITCTVLNWVYPRFMDLVFPNLAGKKEQTEEQKGGNK